MQNNDSVDLKAMGYGLREGNGVIIGQVRL